MARRNPQGIPGATRRCHEFESGGKPLALQTLREARGCNHCAQRLECDQLAGAFTCGSSGFRADQSFANKHSPPRIFMSSVETLTQQNQSEASGQVPVAKSRWWNWKVWLVLGLGVICLWAFRPSGARASAEGA